MRVFITGGSGLLGSNLIKEFTNKGISYQAPTSTECDIVNYNQLIQHLTNTKYDTVIHCAAVAKFKDVEDDPIKGLDVNVLGTCNIVRACILHNIRLVYISTSHVFDGSRGMYKTTDPVNPLTKYAKTKVAGEYIVAMHANSLIIRTEFCGLDFPFDTAYVDKWTSKDYIDKLIPTIVDRSISSSTGICHIGGPRRSFYELGLERNPNVRPGSIKEAQINSKVPILVDTSLDTL